MSRLAPLIVNGPAPEVFPVKPLWRRSREGRPLYVSERDVILDGQFIPRGYVTDFGSIPGFATLLTVLRLQPLGHHAWGAFGHDFGYAVGQPGMRKVFDDRFLARMALDGVNAARRQIMYRAVRLGGQGGYDRAPSWWDTLNFADPETGQPMPPPFAREDAFIGAEYGLPSS